MAIGVDALKRTPLHDRHVAAGALHERDGCHRKRLERRDDVRRLHVDDAEPDPDRVEGVDADAVGAFVLVVVFGFRERRYWRA